MATSLAIIPARGGSKRIPRKNIKLFHGKPLISYSIQTAIASKLFDNIIVSTDDEEIAEVALHYGAQVPFLRPKELADDFTGTDAVISHALDFFSDRNETFDYICTLYATAPFLQQKYLEQGFHALKTSDALYTFSCTSMPFPFQRSFAIVEGRCQMFYPDQYFTRSQDLVPAYHDAGQFYWINNTRRSTTERTVMFSDKSIPILLPRYLVQDIDTLEDWEQAEILYEILTKRQGEINLSH